MTVTKQTMTTVDKARCVSCQRLLASHALKPAGSLRPAEYDLLSKERPECNETSLVCTDDVVRLRRIRVEKLLADERGELSELDRKVLENFEKNESTARAISAETLGEPETFAQRVADRVAKFGGSWTFILISITLLTAWMVMNSHLVSTEPFDPFPFILLNLMLSCVAALQAPVIMMSQRRSEDRDRARAEGDYMVNLRAELEIRQLHEKIDHQMAKQWERLAELQQIQIDLLERR